MRSTSVGDSGEKLIEVRGAQPGVDLVHRPRFERCCVGDAMISSADNKKMGAASQVKRRTHPPHAQLRINQGINIPRPPIDSQAIARYANEDLSAAVHQK